MLSSNVLVGWAWLMFKEDAISFFKLIYSDSNLYGIPINGKQCLVSMDKLVDFAYPYVLKMYVKYQGKQNEIVNGPLLKPFPGGGKVDIHPIDPKLKDILVIGMPWEKTKLLWLMNKKPSGIHIPNKEIIFCIERAFVMNEFDYLMSKLIPMFTDETDDEVKISNSLNSDIITGSHLIRPIGGVINLNPNIINHRIVIPDLNNRFLNDGYNPGFDRL